MRRLGVAIACMAVLSAAVMGAGTDTHSSGGPAGPVGAKAVVDGKAADARARLDAWRDAAGSAIEAYRGENWQSSLDEAKGVLARDGENMVALTVAGLAAARLGDNGSSKAYFTSLAAVDEAGALAENNLAVLAIAQHQYGESLADFNKALEFAPNDRRVMDNAAGGIDVYLGQKGDKQGVAYLRLRKTLDGAQKRLEAEFAGRGLAHYGSKWMPPAEVEMYKSAAAQVQGKLKDLEVPYAAATADARRLESQLASAKAELSTDNLTIEQSMTSPAQRQPAQGLMVQELSGNLASQDAVQMQAQIQQLSGQRDEARGRVKELLGQRSDLLAELSDLSPDVKPPAMMELDGEGDPNPSGAVAGNAMGIGADGSGAADTTGAGAGGNVPPGTKVVQIAILLDTSGSMEALMEQAKTELWQIVDELGKGDGTEAPPQVQVALYRYGTPSLGEENGYIKQLSPLTSDLDDVSAQLFALTNFGGDEYCGWVIKDAVEQLKWSDDPSAVKEIFIAGNEPFTQGPVDFHDSIAKAKAKGITVNPIYCVWNGETIQWTWREAAVFGDGTFSVIGAEPSPAVPTPQDAPLADLGRKLNHTYVPFGSQGQKGAENQVAQDQNASEAGSALGSADAILAERAIAKASASYQNAGWDLVDAVHTGQVQLAALQVADLPAEMQGLDESGREAYVAARAKERQALQAQIRQLAGQRAEYLASRDGKSPVHGGPTALLENGRPAPVGQEGAGGGSHAGNTVAKVATNQPAVGNVSFGEAVISGAERKMKAGGSAKATQ